MNRSLSTILALLFIGPGYHAAVSQAKHIVNISDAAQLQSITGDPDAVYNILADIDASNYELNTTGTEFRGSINGNGHIIKNLRINASGEYAGLFGRMVRCSVSDLILIDTELYLSDPATTYAGVICGVAESCTFTNVRTYYTTLSSDTYRGAFGGICGMMNNGSMSRVMAADACLTLPAASKAGGLAGEITGRATISVCATSGTISADTYLGGIVGISLGTLATIQNCHSDCDLYARHTIGGIMGQNSRIQLNNCVADGYILATAENSTFGAATGGIIGRMEHDPAQYDNPVIQPAILIRSNIARQQAIDVPRDMPADEYPGQHSTAHRIIGATIYNEPPVRTGTDSEGEPVYDSTRHTEKTLSNNYAPTTLAPIDPEINESTHTTEGASKMPDDMDQVFLSQQNFRFGQSATSPWMNPAENYGLKLYFEQKAVEITCTPQELTLYEGDTAEVTFHVSGCDSDWLDIKATHGYALDILYTEYDGRDATVHLYARMACATELTASAHGLSASCRVNAKVGATDIHADTNRALSFDGHMARATGADAPIALYSLDGRMVASGVGSIDTSALPSGVYVVSSGDARLKIVRR